MGVIIAEDFDLQRQYVAQDHFGLRQFVLPEKGNSQIVQREFKIRMRVTEKSSQYSQRFAEELFGFSRFAVHDVIPKISEGERYVPVVIPEKLSAERQRLDTEGSRFRRL